MPPDQPPKPSPYDFIQQVPYTPPPDHHKRRLVISLAGVVLALLVIIAIAASLMGSDKSDNAPAANNQQQTPEELLEYTDSTAFKINYPKDFKLAASPEEAQEGEEFVEPTQTESGQAEASFYKDGNSDSIDAFGVVVTETAEESTELDEEVPTPAASDDFTATLKLYTRDQDVTNVRSAAIKTSGQDGVRTTADFTHDGQPAKITLIVASAAGKTVTTWFTTEASNATFLDQIDPILASFELY